MSRIISLFDSIQTRFPNALISTPDRLLNSVFDFRLHQRNVVPRIPYAPFKEICRNALRGDLLDMRLVSMLYAVGFGLPKDENYCMYWAQMSVLDTPCVPVDSVFEKLKRDVRAAKADYVYPQFVTADRENVLPKNIKLEEEMFGRRMRIFPIYSGMQLNLVYRFHEDTCYLYDAFNHVNDFSIENIYRLNVPQTLNKYVPNYKLNVKNLVNAEPHAMVVSGTLVIPKKLMHYVKASYSGAKSVNDLFSKFCNDKRERHVMDIEKRDKLSDQIANLQKRIDAIKSGETSKTVNAAYKAEFAKYQIDKNEDSAKELRNLKAQFENLKNGKTLQTFQDQLNVKITQLDEFSEDADALRYSYLENVFEFVPNDIFVTNSEGVIAMPLRDQFRTHLQSLGFKTHPELCHYADTIDVNSLVDRFKHPDYTLRAFNVRRVESVNNRTYTVAL